MRKVLVCVFALFVVPIIFRLGAPVPLTLVEFLVPEASAKVDVATLANQVSVNGTSAHTTAAWPIQHGEYFSIMIIAVGSADLEVAYQLSYDGTNWGPEAGANATDPLIANFTSTTWKIYSVSPMVALFVRFIVTGNAGNGASGVSYSLVALQWKK